jgi:membrane protease YdiL (CAAX protease family)
MATVVYLGYRYGLQAERCRRRLAGRMAPAALEITAVVRQRVLGGLLLGLPLIATIVLGLGHSPGRYGLGTPDWASTMAWVAGMAVILVPILRVAARQPHHWQTYPQMRLARWDRRRWWTNTLSWLVYLLGYECLFRGVLLSWLVAELGTWPGILTMNALYAFAHVDKDAGEAWGSAVMGVLFAVMTLQTGAIWAAVAVHWLIAAGSESFAIRANPALRGHDGDASDRVLD